MRKQPSSFALQISRAIGLGAALCLALCPRSFAVAGTSGAAFLNIPTGAGPAALGSAYSASSIDAYAPVWNPAGLGFLDDPQIAGQHLSHLESIHQEYLGAVIPLGDKQGIGVAAQYLGSGDIAGLDDAGNSIGDYSDSFGAYSISYGRSLTDRFAVGLTGKWIHSKLSDISADAYAGDLGSLFRVTEKLDLALTVRNLGTELKHLDEGDPLPWTVHLGSAYRLNPKWQLNAEAVVERDHIWNGRLGVQWSPFDALVLRTGYRSDNLKDLSALAGLSLGFGLKLWGQELAYAWVPYGELGNGQYVSLVIRFGMPIQPHQQVAERMNASDPDHDGMIQLLDMNDKKSMTRRSR